MGAPTRPERLAPFVGAAAKLPGDHDAILSPHNIADCVSGAMTTLHDGNVACEGAARKA